MDAFDADTLIYAAAPGSALGVRVRATIDAAVPGGPAGSALLVPELLIKPTRLGIDDERRSIELLLTYLTLHEVTAPTTRLAVELGARYGLKTVDAVHLATAVLAGADRFVTNNRRDFTKDIAEVDVTYPDELPAA